MKVVVFGSRSWTNSLAIKARIADLPAGTTIVHGRSPGGGADAFADWWGSFHGYDVIPVPISEADRARAKSRRQAPIIRTIRMFDEHPDVELAIGFMVGETPGSAFTRDEAGRRGIPVELHVAS